MEHNGHCFHCGAAVVDNICTNRECQTEAHELPVWPWQVCQGDNCGKMALLCLTRKRDVFRFIGLVIIGICLLLLGIMSFSSRMMMMGIICIVGWLLSRYIYALIRKSYSTILIQESVRQERQSKFDSGEIPDTPLEQKLLKDESDKITSLEFKLSAKLIARRVIYLTTLFLFLVVVISFGPGKIFPWNIENFKGVATQKLDTIKKNNVVQKFIQETKNSLDWDNDKEVFLSNELRGKRNFSYKQYSEIIKHDFFNIDVVLAYLKINRKTNDDLYFDLRDELANHGIKLAIEANQQTINNDAITNLPNKGYFQKIRESVWITLTWLNFFILILITFMVIVGLISYFISWIVGIGDEVADNVKVAAKGIKEIQDLKKKDKANLATGNVPGKKTQSSQTVNVESSDRGSKLNIISSVLGSGLIELAGMLISKVKGAKK